MVATKEQYKQALKGLRDDDHLRNSKYLDLIKEERACHAKIESTPLVS